MWVKLKELFEKHPDWCCGIGVFLAAVLPFLPAVPFDIYIIDDGIYIGQDFLFSLNWSNVKYHLTHTTLGLYSPLVMLSFMLDHLVWGGEILHCGARFHNIILHGCGMVLFYLTLRKLKWNFKDGDDLDFPPAAALFAALAAALHPQRIESVVWIAERKDVLISTLGMAAIYCFIAAYKRSRVSFASPVLLFISLWGVKPMLLTLPLIFTVGFLAAEKKFDIKRALRFLLPSYLATALYLLINLSTYTDIAGKMVSGDSSQSGFSRIFLASYNILVYFVKTFCPVKLNPLYPLVDPAAVSNWYFIILLGIIAILIAGAVIPWEKREFWSKTVLPCGLMFGLAAAPVSSITQIGNVDFADRYSYFPSLFIWAGVAGLAVMIWRNNFQYRKILPVLLSGCLLVLLLINISYLPAWKNEDSQIDAMLDTPTPHIQALKLAAVAELKKNDLANALKWTAVLQSYSHISRADEIFIEGMYGIAEIVRGQAEQGIARLNNFLSKPDWFLIRNSPREFIKFCIFTAANWHLKQRKAEHTRYAANLYIMASQLAGDYSMVDKFNYEGVAMMISGKYPEAELCFINALKLSPDDANIQKNLEAVRKRMVKQ